ncbi:MAG: transposase [Thermoguttaceae bacterium]
MVLAYHVIFGTYGFWLPNDPRGSWSNYVAAWELYQKGGAATKVQTRASLARMPHNSALRIETKKAMKYNPVCLDHQQVQAVSHGFALAAKKCHVPVHACSIMPEHVHLVLGRAELPCEQVMRRFKQEATSALKEKAMLPESPSPWARGGWTVYLGRDETVEQAIRYVEENPIREGLPQQCWSFVEPYV